VPTILLIDDDNQFRSFYSLALGRAGYEVVEAAGGLDGVRAYRESPADVVVCDLFMPGQDGLQTIRELRRLDPAAKVVAMSAGGEGPLTEALALGAAAALQKPFGLPELLGAVGRALAG
jgi:CheY-like chemotaxis protein